MIAAAFLLWAACASAAIDDWTITRSKDGPTATAVPGQGANINGLAKRAGLEAENWRFWIKEPAGMIKKADGKTSPDASDELLPGQKLTIANTIVAVWLGDFSDAGRWLVSWEEDLKWLSARGFHVTVSDKPECKQKECLAAYGRELKQEILNESAAGTLHGLFITAHGDVCAATDKGHNADLDYDQLAAGLKYKLGLVIVNACHSGGEKPRKLSASGGKFYGVEGLMLPIFQTGHPDELLKPGEQGTIPPKPGPRLRPKRAS